VKEDDKDRSCRMHRRDKLVLKIGRKIEGERPLGRQRCRWEDNIKTFLRETGCGVVDWMHLAQDKDK
jgi:hypothetical protein